MSYDLIIIGGGILGAATARDAAYRGKSVLLLEKGYFAHGASAKTSKLAHGGLRYLEQGAFSLVRESVIERNLLLKLAPERVKPLPFLIPVYKESRRPLWQIKIGLMIYSWFSRGGPMPKHQVLNLKEIENHCPGLESKNLKGALLYYDAQMQDKALTLDVIADAQKQGAHCHPHHELVKVSPLKNGDWQVSGTHKGTPFTFEGKNILFATGPWSNPVIQKSFPQAEAVVRPSKGSHILLKKQLSKVAITLTAPQDGRVFFILPYRGQSLVGTTEEDFKGNPDDLTISDLETDYLLAAVNAYYPKNPVTKKDITGSFSGLRPLSISKAKLATQASRELKITRHAKGVYSVVGGKYTTFRAIGETVTNNILGPIKQVNPTLNTPLQANAYPLKNFIEDHAGFLKIGHRGFCQHNGCIENTLEAFQAAINQGCNMLECDLQLSQSGSVFIFHDETGERLLNEKVTLSNLDDAAIEKLTFKNHPKANIPFLKNYLNRFKHLVYFYLEIKPQKDLGLEKTCLKKTHEIVSKLGLLSEVFYATFSVGLLKTAGQDPFFKNSLFSWNVCDKALFQKDCEEIKKVTNILCPEKELFSVEELAKLIEEGWFIIPFTIKNERDRQRLKTLNLSGLTSDI